VEVGKGTKKIFSWGQDGALEKKRNPDQKSKGTILAIWSLQRTKRGTTVNPISDKVRRGRYTCQARRGVPRTIVKTPGKATALNVDQRGKREDVGRVPTGGKQDRAGRGKRQPSS